MTEDTRKAILEAALQIVGESGFEKLKKGDTLYIKKDDRNYQFKVIEVHSALKGAIAKDTVFMGLSTILNFYEHNDDPTGPLFWAHYSYLGLNPKGLKDRYADYWQLNVNQAMIHYLYALVQQSGVHVLYLLSGEV